MLRLFVSIWCVLVAVSLATQPDAYGNHRHLRIPTIRGSANHDLDLPGLPPGPVPDSAKDEDAEEEKKLIRKSFGLPEDDVQVEDSEENILSAENKKTQLFDDEELRKADDAGKRFEEMINEQLDGSYSPTGHDSSRNKGRLDNLGKIEKIDREKEHKPKAKKETPPPVVPPTGVAGQTVPSAPNTTSPANNTSPSPAHKAAKSPTGKKQMPTPPLVQHKRPPLQVPPRKIRDRDPHWLLHPSVGVQIPAPNTTNERCLKVQNLLYTVSRDLDQSVRREKFQKMGVQLEWYNTGSLAIYYHDVLDPNSIYVDWSFSSQHTMTYVAGNVHVNSLGAYADPDGDVVFDINNFDEGWVTDYQIDLWRLAVSIGIHARENNFDLPTQLSILDKFTHSYYRTARFFTHNNKEERIKFSRQNTYGPMRRFLKHAELIIANQHPLERFCTRNPRKLKRDELSVTPTPEETKTITDHWELYGTTLSGGVQWDKKYFGIKDIVRRLHTGLAELEKAHYWVLIEGPTSSPADDIILQVVHQGFPAWAISASKRMLEYNEQVFDSDAERVIKTRYAMQNRVDTHVGWFNVKNESFTVDRFHPYMGHFPTETLKTQEDFEQTVEQWGALLAAAHARADNDFDKEWISWSWEDGFIKAVGTTPTDIAKFQQSVAKVAMCYIQQLELDFKCFQKGLSSGAFAFTE